MKMFLQEQVLNEDEIKAVSGGALYIPPPQPAPFPAPEWPERPPRLPPMENPFN
jgi:hypothetical protein